MIVSRMRIVRVILALTLVFFFVSGLFAGGGSQGGQQSGGASGGTYPTGKISYPIKTDAALTYWVGMNANISPNYTNYGDVPYYRGLQERTGVRLTFLHPPVGAENEQFNLIIASGDFPDLFDWDILGTYPGGPEKAISDGTILKLNDLFAGYAPNLKEILSSRQDWDRMVKTDNGNYYCFPFIRGDVGLCVWQGLQIRKDWLDELGLQSPETYDDWHTVLAAFKARKNSPAPLAIPYNNSSFMYGYGFDLNFYIGNDGKVTWGRIQPAFRDYLAMMAQWYREGLLDPDTATLTAQQITTKITNGTAGAVHGGTGGNMGSWLPAGRATNSAYRLLGVKSPVVRKGDKLTMINIDNPYHGGSSVSIGGKTKYPEVAARLLDWGYVNDGYLYSNFGTPGVSYNMVNGSPVYTDAVMKNSQGWPVGQSLASYVRSVYGGPFIQSIDYFKQYLTFPEQLEAVQNWSIDDPFRHKMPPITPTPAESQEIARIMTEINTYSDEMLVKYILGTESLSTFDNYVNTIRRMGIDRAIEIYNAALVRFNNR